MPSRLTPALASTSVTLASAPGLFSSGMEISLGMWVLLPRGVAGPRVKHSASTVRGSPPFERSRRRFLLAAAQVCGRWQVAGDDFGDIVRARLGELAQLSGKRRRGCDRL